MFQIASLVALCAALADPAAGRDVKILLVTGQDLHKWQETTPVVLEILRGDPRLRVKVVEEPSFLADPSIHAYDAIVMHWMNYKVPAPGTEARENYRRYVARGKGTVLVHFACGAWQDWPEFREVVGRVWDPKLRGHDPRGKFQVVPTEVRHPITTALKPFEADDELYTCLTGDGPIQVLAQARSKVDGRQYPMAFVYEHGKGRVYQCLLGHDAKALRQPGVDQLLLRGALWAAGVLK